MNEGKDDIKGDAYHYKQAKASNSRRQTGDVHALALPASKQLLEVAFTRTP
jgi:hypothetical protein